MFITKNSQEENNNKIIDVESSSFFEVIDFSNQKNIVKVKLNYKLQLSGFSKKEEENNYYKNFGILNVKVKPLDYDFSSLKKSKNLLATKKSNSINSLTSKKNISEDVNNKLLRFTKLKNNYEIEKSKFILEKDINFSEALINVNSSYYSVNELAEANLNAEDKINYLFNNANSNVSDITTLDCTKFVKDNIDPSDIVGFQAQSNSDLESTTLPSFYKDTLKTIFSLSKSKVLNEVQYVVKQKNKKLPYVLVEAEISLDYTEYGKKFLIVSQIRKSKNDDGEIYETFEQEIDLSEQIFAATIPINHPHVTVKSSKKDVTLFISSNPVDAKKILGYNIYSKEISPNNSVSTFEKILTNVKDKVVLDKPQTKTIFRITPVIKEDVESFCFTNVIVGENINESLHKFAALSLSVYQIYNRKNVNVEIHNLPQSKFIKVEIYRRDLNDSKLSLVFETTLNSLQDKNFSTTDNGLVVNRFFEYFAKITYEENQKYVTCYSETQIIKHADVLSNKPIEVIVENFENSVVFFDRNEPSSNLNDYSASFDITVKLEKTFTESLTNYIKNQEPEFYSQFLDPANNNINTLDQSIAYSSIFVHEVHRLNLTIGERHVYPLVGINKFEDTEVIRNKENIPGINLHNEYEYQIFSYKREPLTLIKGYIVSGVDKTGKNWFYSPYKWKNPRVINTGMLAADEDTSDDLEVLKSESYGLTVRRPLNVLIDNVSEPSVFISRVDKNTIYVGWNIQKAYTVYDSYLIVKVVNGIKTIATRSKENYAYVELNENDIGSVRFEIVPISNDFIISNSFSSNSLIVTVESIQKPLKISNVSLSSMV